MQKTRWWGVGHSDVTDRFSISVANTVKCLHVIFCQSGRTVFLLRVLNQQGRYLAPKTQLSLLLRNSWPEWLLCLHQCKGGGNIKLVSQVLWGTGQRDPPRHRRDRLPFSLKPWACLSEKCLMGKKFKSRESVVKFFLRSRSLTPNQP